VRVALAREELTVLPAALAVVAAVATLADAVEDTGRILTHRSGSRIVGGALAYLLLDVLVLFFAFTAIHAHPAPTFGVVVMAYIIGALGGSIPLPAAIGTVGGMVGMFILYGVERNTAVAAVLLYQAVGLLVPLIGGGIAYLLLRRRIRRERRRRCRLVQRGAPRESFLPNWSSPMSSPDSVTSYCVRAGAGISTHAAPTAATDEHRARRLRVSGRLLTRRNAAVSLNRSGPRGKRTGRCAHS
jgi:hypothetical protein